MDRNINDEIAGLYFNDRRMPSGAMPSKRTVTAIGRRLYLRVWPQGVEMMGSALPLARQVARHGNERLELAFDTDEGSWLMLLRDVHQIGREYMSAVVENLSQNPA